MPKPAAALRFALCLGASLVTAMMVAGCGADTVTATPANFTPVVDSGPAPDGGVGFGSGGGEQVDAGGQAGASDGDGDTGTAHTGITDAGRAAGQDTGDHAEQDTGSGRGQADSTTAPTPDAGPTAPEDTGPTCQTAPCTAASDCPASMGGGAGSCTLVLCSEGCCVATQALDGSGCDDGDPCTTGDTCAAGSCKGTATDCDDQLDCTKDACGSDGKCTHTIAADKCLIDEVCVATGAAAKTSVCLTCQPGADAEKWTKNPGCCMADADCPAANPCQTTACDVATGKCSVKLKAGCCQSDQQCDDGNACTLQTCDKATGKCAYVAKTCADPTVCEVASCDAKTGDCAAAIKPGFCKIGGQCVPTGNADPFKKCMRCDPAKSTKAYTAAAGKACDDGNVCTTSDTCAADGSCKGAAKKGCCAADTDCKAPSACVISTCDLKVNVCIESAKKFCCDKGTCCSVPTNQIKGPGSKCPGGPIAVEYKCDGSNVMHREVHPGCDGVGGEGCSSDPKYVYRAPWYKKSACPPGQVCKSQDINQQPACEKQTGGGGPTGDKSCKGLCGKYDKARPCQCDTSCGKYGDCCADYAALCSGNGCGVDPNKTCQGKCGNYTKGAPCQCDALCAKYGDCCSDLKACGC